MNISSNLINISSQPFPKKQILDPSKLKEVADANFKLDKNSRIFSKWLEKTVGKGEIGRYEQFLLFSLAPPGWLSGERVNLVVASSIPGQGDFSFRRIFASHLYRSM